MIGLFYAPIFNGLFIVSCMYVVCMSKLTIGTNEGVAVMQTVQGVLI